jgi:NAD(P)-dependent dehydrogenase (short-subunit alcohol dehydrogenase family)
MKHDLVAIRREGLRLWLSARTSRKRPMATELEQGGGRIVTISMSEAAAGGGASCPTVRPGRQVEALSRVMAADLADSPLTVNLLLPGGATDTGMIPDDTTAEAPAGVHEQRIIAVEFGQWLAARVTSASLGRFG